MRVYMYTANQRADFYIPTNLEFLKNEFYHPNVNITVMYLNFLRIVYNIMN